MTSFEVYAERRGRWLALPTVLLAIAAVIAFAALHQLEVVAALGVIYAMVESADRSARGKHVLVIDELGVHIGKTTIPRGRILDAQAGADPGQLLLTKEDGSTVGLYAKDEGERDAILAAIAKGGTAARGRIPEPGSVFALGLATLGLSAALALGGTALMFVLAIAIPALLGAWLLGLEQVTAARDGIQVRSRRKSRFVAYADIARLDGDRVVLKSGESISLTPNVFAVACDPTLRFAQQRMLDVVREGIARKPSAEQARAESVLAMRERGNGPEASAQRATNSGYRDIDVPDEDLWRVVEAPDAKPELRVRAAEMIRARAGTKEVRYRIADIASETAQADARASLLRIAEEEEETEGRSRATAPYTRS